MSCRREQGDPPVHLDPPDVRHAAPAPAQPKRGGTLNVGLIGNITGLEGHLNSNGSTQTWQVYDRLTAYNDKFQPQPELAESWELNPSFTQIKLNLRRGVQFHSGR